LVDKHPAYFVSQAGRNEARVLNIGIEEIQHHKAHFAAVLAENNLIKTNEDILGVIWDGTGYGDDKHIWGSEIFLYRHNEIKRVAHLDYFPQLLGNKMNKEPRLSALSLLIEQPDLHHFVKHHFKDEEWKYYLQLIKQEPKLFTSSMGRFLDGVAAMLGICSVNTYEGEAAMKLEALAQNCLFRPSSNYNLPLINGKLCRQPFIKEMTEDIYKKHEIGYIAKKVFSSLANAIAELSRKFSTEKIAFSGGVFQNALLTDLVKQEMENKQLYFHRQLSPNDECISFGQLAYYFINKKAQQNVVKQPEFTELIF